MNIAVFSDTETTGGAGIALSRLCYEWSELGLNVHRIVPFKNKVERNWSTYDVKYSRKLSLLQIFNSHRFQWVNLFIKHLKFSEFYKQIDTYLKNIKPDIINIHNIHTSDWPIGLISKSTHYAPTVWTLHDEWAIDGKVYNNYCSSNRYAERNVQKFWNQINNDEKEKLWAISPSQWLAQEASMQRWHQTKVNKIHNGIPLSVFKPYDKIFSRSIINNKKNIDSTSELIFMLTSGDLTEERKGWQFIIPALKALQPWRFSLLLMGRNSKEFKGIFPNEIIYDMGFVQDDMLKAIMYSACDLLIHPAPVDNLPNTVVESIACGTPVASFHTGGLPEMVIDGETGWKSHEISSLSLETLIRKVISNLNNKVQLHESCIDFAHKNFCSQKQANQYIEFFREIVP